MLKLLVFSLDNLSSNNPWELDIVHRLLGMLYCILKPAQSTSQELLHYLSKEVEHDLRERLTCA